MVKIKLLEDAVKKTKYRPTDKRTISFRLDLEPERENNLQILNHVLANELNSTVHKIGRNKIIKICIDYTVKNLLKLENEDKQVKELIESYKEALF